MRYVTFYSQIDASALTKPHYVISIRDYGKPSVRFSCEHKAVLELAFDDVEDYVAGNRLFSITQARSLYDWARKVPEGEEVVVHCLAGVSRSAAVAKFMHDHLGFMLLLEYPCCGTLKDYNSHVYGLLRIQSADRSMLQLAADAEVERLVIQKEW